MTAAATPVGGYSTHSFPVQAVRLRMLNLVVVLVRTLVMEMAIN